MYDIQVLVCTHNVQHICPSINVQMYGMCSSKLSCLNPKYFLLYVNQSYRHNKKLFKTNTIICKFFYCIINYFIFFYCIINYFIFLYCIINYFIFLCCIINYFKLLALLQHYFIISLFL